MKIYVMVTKLDFMNEKSQNIFQFVKCLWIDKEVEGW